MKYIVIAESILADINSGKLKPGDKLPTEKQLIEKYGVSKMTIRKTLELLIKRGYVYSIRGSGIFVSLFPDFKQFKRISKLLPNTTSAVHSSSTKISKKLLDMFCIDEDQKNKDHWFPYVTFYINKEGQAIGYTIAWAYDPKKKFTKDMVGGKIFNSEISAIWSNVVTELSEFNITKATSTDKNILRLKEDVVPTYKTAYLNDKERPLIIALIKVVPQAVSIKHSKNIH